MSRNSITPSRAFLTIARVGADRLAVGGGQRAARLRLGRARRDLDQAHAAIAGDRQPLVVAEARDLLARKLARLEHGRALRDLELDAVDGDLRHRRRPLRRDRAVVGDRSMRGRRAGRRRARRERRPIERDDRITTMTMMRASYSFRRLQHARGRRARRCGARARGGNGGSGPGSARRRRRRARRWCGPRPAW